MESLYEFLEYHRVAVRAISVAVVANISCALLGCYLVLRRMSMIGDAISHAVLPGIVLAFLFTGQITGLPIVLGAMLLGILTTYLTQTFHSIGKVTEDASMGVVFTTLFAIGVILVSSHAGKAHLDADCVLYGDLLDASLRTIKVWGWKIPAVLKPMAFTLVATLIFIAVFWKELKITSFDPALATSMGLNATLVHYLLMAMVGGVTVAAFEAVGSILVIAMLIVPAATAHLLTDRLVFMLMWAALVSVLSSVMGYLFAAQLNTSAAGMMAVVAGGLFALAVLLAPRHGVLSKMARNARLALRIACEDVLALLYRTEEAHHRGERVGLSVPRHEASKVVHGWTGWLALPLLRYQGQVAVSAEGTLQLTEEGRQRAESLVRSHRLWESYLEENLALPLDHLHEPAERMEHFIGADLQKEIASQLRQPDRDPHGRVIPSPKQ